MSQHKRARKERRRESRSIQRELARSGAKARLDRVRLAVREPVFMAQLQDAIAWAEVTPSIRSVDQIRDLALGVLVSMGIPTEGINFTVVWTPPKHPLSDRTMCICGHERFDHAAPTEDRSVFGKCSAKSCECLRFDREDSRLDIRSCLLMEVAQAAIDAAKAREEGAPA